MYIVIKNLASGECSIIRANDHYENPYEKVYGPDTRGNCAKWIRQHCKSK